MGSGGQVSGSTVAPAPARTQGSACGRPGGGYGTRGLGTGPWSRPSIRVAAHPGPATPATPATRGHTSMGVLSVSERAAPPRAKEANSSQVKPSQAKSHEVTSAAPPRPAPCEGGQGMQRRQEGRGGEGRQSWQGQARAWRGPFSHMHLRGGAHLSRVQIWSIERAMAQCPARKSWRPRTSRASYAPRLR